MAYQIKGGVIINDSRDLVNVGSAGINTSLTVGGIQMDAVAGVVTATEFVGGGSNLTGIVQSGGDGDLGDLNVSGVATVVNLNITGVSTFGGNVDLDGNDILNGGAGNFASLSVTNDITSGSLDVAGHIEGDSLNISGVSTFGANVEVGTTAALFFADSSAVQITGFVDEDAMTSDSDVLVPTQQSVKAYVDSQVGAANQLTFTGNTGATGDIDLATETLSVDGTANQIVTDVPTALGEDLNISLSSTLQLPGTLAFGSTGQAVNEVGVSSALGTSDGILPTQKAVKEYVDAQVTGGSAAATLNIKGDGGADVPVNLQTGNIDFTSTANQVDATVTPGGTPSDSDTVNFSLSSDLVAPGTLEVTGVSTFKGNAEFGTGTSIFFEDTSSVLINEFSTDGTLADNSDTAIPTEQAVKTYVDAQVGADSTLNIAGDTGTGSIDISAETFSIVGTSLEVETSALNQTITIGLPDDVTIGGSLIVTNNFSFDGGQTVDEISTDVLLADDSDTAIPTEKAVKTYVDAQVSGGGGSSATILTANNQDNTAYSVSFVSATGAGSSVYTDASQLNYNPSTGLLVAQDFNSLSDIRYKENVETIDGAVDKVKQLRGVEFDWKKTPGSSVGVIAQEVQEVYPQLVTEGEEKITVNYNGLVGLLIQAVKEQADEIAALKEKLG
jgi:hypothetical protein